MIWLFQVNLKKLGGFDGYLRTYKINIVENIN